MRKRGIATEKRYRYKIASFSYLLLPFSGMAFYLLEPEDKFIRFHAMQSILLGSIGIVFFMLLILLTILVGVTLPMLGPVLLFPLWIIFIILFLFLLLYVMYKAWEGKVVHLPWIGEIAERHT